MVGRSIGINLKPSKRYYRNVSVVTCLSIYDLELSYYVLKRTEYCFH